MITLPSDTELIAPVAGMRRLGVVLVYLGVGALVLFPLLWISVPVLIDYPSHLARVWLTAQGEGASSGHYVARWRWIPNLAMELVVPWFARLMPMEQAGRLFVAIAMLLPVIGTMTLRRALFGRVGLWPLAAFLFVYSAVLQWGFVNYLFGMGVALLLFSAWVASARWKMMARLGAFAIAVVVLFYLHLFAFGIYALLAASWEAGAWWRGRDWTLSGIVARAWGMAQFVPAGCLFLLGAGGDGPRYTAYGDLASKLLAVSAPMGFGDLGLMLGLMVFPLTLIAWHAGLLRIAAGMGVPIIVLIITALAMPNWVMGSWGADMRMPAVLPFVVIAASRPMRVDRRVCIGVAALALGLLIVRVGGLAASWAALDRQFGEFRAAASQLPQEVRLLIVISDLGGKQNVPGVPDLLVGLPRTAYFHMPMLAIIDRGAFVPYLYTSWTTIAPVANAGRPAHSVGAPLTPEELRDALRPERRAEILAARDILGAAPYWVDWPDKFDFVVWIDFGQKPDDLPAPLRDVHAGSFFHIYRIVPR